jgi:hypothetical protein
VHRGAGVARRPPVGGALDQRRPRVVEELEPDVELGQLRLEDLEDRPLVGVALLGLVPELEPTVRVARLGEELLGPRRISLVGPPWVLRNVTISVVPAFSYTVRSELRLSAGSVSLVTFSAMSSSPFSIINRWVSGS